MEPKNYWVVEDNSFPKVYFQVPCGSLPGCNMFCFFQKRHMSGFTTQQRLRSEGQALRLLGGVSAWGAEVGGEHGEGVKVKAW